jgi:hypothetical protein
MAHTPVVDLNGKPYEPKPKQTREQVKQIEERPRPDWLVSGQDQWGKIVWYVRLEITGLLPRLFGPFPSRRKSLLFLDDAVGHLSDHTSDLQGYADKYIVERPFFQRGWCRPTIETPELSNKAVSITPPNLVRRNPRQ